MRSIFASCDLVLSVGVISGKVVAKSKNSAVFSRGYRRYEDYKSSVRFQIRFALYGSSSDMLVGSPSEKGSTRITYSFETAALPVMDVYTQPLSS
jgi:hypothetical protein